MSSLAQRDAWLNSRAVIHETSDEWEARASRRGFAAAVSVLSLALHEYDGDYLDRGVAEDITRRVLRAYLDQIGEAR